MFKLAQRLPKSVSSLGNQLSKVQNAPNQLMSQTAPVTFQLINTPGIRYVEFQ